MRIAPESGGFSGRRRRALDDAHDVAPLHDQELLAIELDFSARPFAEQNPVSGLEIKRNQLAALVATARSDGDHFAFLRLLLGGVGNNDPAFGFLFRVDTPDDDA